MEYADDAVHRQTPRSPGRLSVSPDIEFSDDNETFLGSQQFQDIKSWTHEHLLSRIEELGAEFGRWSRGSIQQFVRAQVALSDRSQHAMKLIHCEHGRGGIVDSRRERL